MPDGDAPPEENLNMRHLYEMFKNTNSHGIVSEPFLGLIQYYLEENDQTLIKNALSELHYNLSYMTLSGGRDFRFDAISELTARWSMLLKHGTLGNRHLREIENENLARKIDEDRKFEAKIEDSLEEIIEIIDLPDLNIKNQCFHMTNQLLRQQTKSKQNKNLLTMILLIYNQNLTNLMIFLQSKKKKKK